MSLKNVARVGDLFMSLIIPANCAALTRSTTSPSCSGMPPSWHGIPHYGCPGTIARRFHGLASVWIPGRVR